MASLRVSCVQFVRQMTTSVFFGITWIFARSLKVGPTRFPFRRLGEDSVWQFSSTRGHAPAGDFWASAGLFQFQIRTNVTLES